MVAQVRASRERQIDDRQITRTIEPALESRRRVVVRNLSPSFGRLAAAEPGDPMTDAARLAAGYESADPLLDRRAIYSYLERPSDITRDIVDLIQASVSRPRMLDVGCGPGTHLANVGDAIGARKRFALDFSAAMASEARSSLHSAGGSALVGDAQSLPFADDQFDVVLALHMLYHVPDIDRACREINRVMTDDATVVVTTNSDRHLHGLSTLVARSVEALIGEPLAMPPTPPTRFSAENGEAILLRTFSSVSVRSTVNRLVVPKADPVVRYVNSTQSSYEHGLPANVSWAGLIEACRSIVEGEIRERGAWIDDCGGVIFICRSA